MKLHTLFTLLPTLLFQNLCFAHSWMAPEIEAQKSNPIPISTESVQQGQALFAELCGSCHGTNAAGMSKEETGLNKDTPNLPTRLKTHTDGDFHWE
ncbi:cytochrome c [Desulfopila sp. IMCC35008]|uniref:c-type cytochrome n=1 Tax=Desulfopila sp. IMCC35008 TaxID=2653858 RepID=UPI0013D4E778|nr:cytochrome c [Desulfopila sp. IMCC35008]